MSIFEQLAYNKGTVSSALGKEIAVTVLKGKVEALREAIDLSSYESENKKAKNIRAGAAKVVEIVAEKRPDLVAPFLPQRLPALTVPEPQTRWMIIRTMGFCAHLDSVTAGEAVPYAQEYICEKEGLCIASSADLFLGDYGSISSEAAETAFPILEISISNCLRNEEDWLLEVFMKIARKLNKDRREIIKRFAVQCRNAPKKATQKRVDRLLKLLDDD